MQKIDDRIVQILNKRGIKTSREIEEYFNPSISLLCDPLKIDGIQTAVDRIKQAIENKESVVIYGDYDADGVSSAAILYLFLKSKGLTPSVFIPNRFEDGYGLSAETINSIAENLFPDLLITVDCGITAVDEVEQLNDIGIDVIVTDHHLPGETLPQALAIIDAKVNQNEVFLDYCGAGIVLKLIEALGGNIMDYIDIAAIATIGDIVPLIFDNRVIASVGLSKFNSANCNIGLAALRESNIQNYSAQDVAFKIVPRLNSAGRMDSAKIAFNLLVSETQEEAQQNAKALEELNSKRLNAISSSLMQIESQLKKTNFNESNCIIVKSKDFHEGVLGILAARLVGDYNLPVFVFSEVENGLLKGSCRCPDGIDIHEALMPLSSLFVRMGGHKQAAGITITQENFNEFKIQISEQLKLQHIPSIAREPLFDFEINDQDITLDFVKQLERMEPTGCGNEKLVFKMKLKNCIYKKSNNPKHYQIITENKKYIMCFNGKQYEQEIESNNAIAYLTLGTEIYNNQIRIKTKLNNIGRDNITTASNEDAEFALVCDAFEGLETTNKIQYKNSKDECIETAKEESEISSILVVARTMSDAKYAKEKLNFDIEYTIPSNQKSCILYAPRLFSKYENVEKYDKIVAISGSFSAFSSQNLAQVISYKEYPKLKKEKEIFASCYRVFASQILPAQNDIAEYVDEIKKYLPYSSAQIAFCLAVFIELEFFNYKDDLGNFKITIKSNQTKKELSKSNLYNQIKGE